MNNQPTFGLNSWLDTEVTEQSARSYSGDQKCDWLIIGAGFTGLGAAYRIAELRPSDRVILVDAANLQDGTSSLSSGFVVTVGHFGGSKRESRALYRLGKQAIAILEDQVDRYSIACDWNSRGRLIGARGSTGQGSLQRIKRVFDGVGAPYESLSGAEVKELTGLSGYVDSIRQSDSAMVNPAKLHRGLADALPGNVELFERSPVNSIEKSDNWIAQLPGGRISAQRVLVANNAFACQLGVATRRVFPMRTFVSSFDVADNGSNHPGAEQDWGITSVERIGSSLRCVNGKVFLRCSAVCGFDSNGSMASDQAKVVAEHKQSIQSRFPWHDVRLENTWSGVIGVTANGSQIFGQLDDGLFVSTGYNGHGIAQGTISGRLMVDLALGQKSELLNDVASLPKPWWIPGHKILFPIVNAYMRYLNWRYQDEL